MTAVYKFEDLEIWQLAKRQYSDLQTLVTNAPLAEDDGLQNAMKASSASVLECITEGFKRPGNHQFQKNFLVIAKSFNNEYCSQLNQFFQRKHVDRATFDELYEQNQTLGSMIGASIRDLQQSGLKKESNTNSDVVSQEKH